MKLTLTLLTALLLASPVALQAVDAALRQKPNILLLLADDMGYSDLGCQGAPDIRTPFIDTLAREGILCGQGYVTGVMCSPSRAGIMSGRSPNRFGYDINWRGEDSTGRCGLPLTEKTMADYLSEKGYVTGAVGKWHLGDVAKFHPLKRGFAEFFGFTGGGHTYLCDKLAYAAGAKRNGYNTPIEQNGKEVVTKGYLTDVLGEASADFIHRNREKTWFLYAAFNAPHTPLEAKPEDLALFESVTHPKRKTYCAMVYALDRAVGRILQQLENDGIENDTLIFFLSDNGGPGLEVNGSMNTPLSGKKGTVLEGGIRVPYIVRWKGHLPEHQNYANPVSSLDILATSLSLADPQAPLPEILEGVNLIPYLQGIKTETPHPTLFWRCENRHEFAARDGNYKLIQQKFVKIDSTGVPRLIDLAQDLQELQDLSKASPGKMEALIKAYIEWNSKNIPPQWGEGADVHDLFHQSDQ